MPEQPDRPSEHRGPPEHRDAGEAVSWGVRVAAAWTWRLLLIGFGIYVFVRIFGRVELVAFSFVLALFFTAVLHPLERRLRFIPGPRSLSALLALLIGLLILAGVGSFVAWQISNHATQLSNQVTDLVNNTRDYLRNGPLHLRSKDLDKIASNITDALKNNKGVLVSSAIETLRAVIEALGALLLILLSTFFLLRDGESIWHWTLRLFPSRAQQRIDVAGCAGWHTVGGYIRGQVLIALFHGVAVTIILLVLQVPLAAALGVLIFLGSFVPIIGLVVAGFFASAIALLEHGLTAAIVVAIAITVLVQLEAHLLQPLIMSRSVEVHPLAIALSVLTGTVLAGIVGALLAVPLVAFLNSTIHALRQSQALPVGDSTFPVRHRESLGGDDVDGAVPPTDDQSDGDPDGDPDGDSEAKSSD